MALRAVSFEFRTLSREKLAWAFVSVNLTYARLSRPSSWRADGAMESEGLLRAGEAGLVVADVVGSAVDGDDDGAVGVGGAAGIGVVGEEILGAEFAVDAIEGADGAG